MCVDARARTTIEKKQFSGLPSRGLKWEKKKQNIQAKKVYSYVPPLILVK